MNSRGTGNGNGGTGNGKKRNRNWEIKQEQEKGNDIENETLIYILIDNGWDKLDRTSCQLIIEFPKRRRFF